MKKLSLAVLLTLPLMANATGLIGGASANAGAVALSGSSANAGAISNANNSQGGLSVDIENRRQFPNGTAIGAASSNTTAPFRYLDSHSTSVLFFARSKTTMKFDIVTFVMSEPNEEAKAAACFAEEEYKEFRKYINKPCQ